MGTSCPFTFVNSNAACVCISLLVSRYNNRKHFLNISFKHFLYYKQKKVKIRIRWVCVHKSLCNGTETTDDEITKVLKFKDHNHEGNKVLIDAGKAKCVMKNAKKKITIYHFEFLHEM